MAFDESNLQQFGEALKGFIRSISAISSSREECHPPELPSNPTDQECRKALRDALTTLSDISPEAALGEDEVNEFVSFFDRLYCGNRPYRHLYSDVCSVMYEYLSTDSSKLDDGVPYQSRNLASNMEIIYRAIDAKDFQENVKRSVYKLYDHIELENTRMTYMARQNKAQMDGVKTLHEEVINVGHDAQEIQSKLDQSVKTLDSHLADTQDRLQRNYITILGIFAAIVIAFATGGAFSSAVLSNMERVSVYRLSFVLLVVGLFLFDLVMALFFFICRVSKFQEGEHLPDIAKNVNALFIIGIALTLFFRFFRVFG